MNVWDKIVGNQTFILFINNPNILYETLWYQQDGVTPQEAALVRVYPDIFLKTDWKTWSYRKVSHLGFLAGILEK